MPRDFTARRRDALLRQDRDENGGPDYLASPIENPSGDWTARLARELRAKHDDDSADDDWLRTNSGTYQGPVTWESS
jgi:hypothetical protein